MSGNNSFTGTTTVANNATLYLTGIGSIANSSGVGNNGTFDISGTSNGASITTLTGNGNVALGSKNLMLTNASGATGGVISGAGGLRINGGSETVTGINTYTGTTTVDQGATLALSGNGDIAHSSGLANSGTFDISSTNNGATLTTLSGNGNVSLGSKSLTLSNASGTTAGIISGSGSLHVAAGAENLAGANTYTGATTVDQSATLSLTGNGSIASSSGLTDNGTLNISGTNNGASITTLAGNGSIALGGKSLTLTNAVGNFAGGIAGTGGINVTGGSQTLSGTNSYTGGTAINNATVNIASDQNLGDAAGTLTINNGMLHSTQGLTTSRHTMLSGDGSFRTDTSTTLTDNGDIAGSGALVKDGAGTMVVNGTVSHSGGTHVNNGVLTFNGDNTYTGGTIVDMGGILQVGKDAALGDISNSVLLNGGTLQVINSFGTARNITVTGNSHVQTDTGGTLSTSGTVSGNGAFIKDGTGTLLLNGVASQSGGIFVNGGIVALNADNTFTGSATVNAGGTLQVAKDAALGDTANSVVLNSSALHATESFNTARNIVLTGNGHINTDADITVTVAASGTVSGSGALVKDGTGSLIIDGVASFAGGTVINGGVLALNADNTYIGDNVVNVGGMLTLAKDAALGAIGNNIILNDGVLHATNSFDTARTIAVAGNNIINTDAGSNVRSSGNVSGTGALVKSGDGTLTLDGTAMHAGGNIVSGGVLVLNGDNTYTGGNIVNAGGTLQVAKDSALGNAGNSVVLNGGTLYTTGSFDTARNIALFGNDGARVNVDDGAMVTSAGAVFGNAALMKEGSGTLVLNGLVSHTGGNIVNNGTLVLGGDNSFTGGNVVNAGAILQVAKDAALGDATNGITLNGGALHTTDTFNTSRNMVLAGNSSINTDKNTTLTQNGKLIGAGRMFKDGSGTLILTGDNSAWTGGTTIDAGVVRVTSSTGLGTGDVLLNGGMIEGTVSFTASQIINVAGNSTLFAQTGTTMTLTGALNSVVSDGVADCFIKSGNGTLNMKGTAVLKNGTCLQQGVLRANGTFNSAITVGQGAMLRGSGFITGPVTVGGTLAPGNSPGTLTVAATVTMTAGSNFQADINGLGTASGPGNYSRLLVTGAGHQYIANGAKLTPNLVAVVGVASYTPYVPNLGESFRIVTADGGIVGRFAPLAQPAGLANNTRMAVFYNAEGSNSIDLRVVPVAYASFFANGSNSNIQRSAKAIDQVMTLNDQGTATNNQVMLAYAVTSANASQLPNLAAALVGQVHGAIAAVAPLPGQLLQSTLVKQLAMNSPSGTSGATAAITPAQALWIDLSGSHAKWNGDETADSFAANNTQLTIGADLIRNGNSRVGAGVSHAETSVTATMGSGLVNQNLLFVYGEQALGRVKVDAMAGTGRSKWDSRRGDPFQGVGTLENKVKGTETIVSAGIRAPWQVQGFALEPFARVAWQKSSRDGFQENTASAAALQLSAYSATGTRLLAGIAGGSQIRDPLAAANTLHYSMGVGRDNGSLVRPKVSASLGDMASTIMTPEVGRNFVQANLEGTTNIAKQSYAYYGLSGEARSGMRDVSITGGMRIRF